MAKCGDDAQAAAGRGRACGRASPEAVMTEEIVARNGHPSVGVEKEREDLARALAAPIGPANAMGK